MICYTGDVFHVTCGVRQGGVLSPYLFAVYIDDLITHLKNSGYGIYVDQIFTGCALYADDIALLSALLRLRAAENVNYTSQHCSVKSNLFANMNASIRLISFHLPACF